VHAAKITNSLQHSHVLLVLVVFEVVSREDRDEERERVCVEESKGVRSDMGESSTARALPFEREDGDGGASISGSGLMLARERWSFD
jgi:hypothetical protein